MRKKLKTNQRVRRIKLWKTVIIFFIIVILFTFISILFISCKVGFSGLMMEHPFIKRTLEKLGLEPLLESR